MIDLSQIPTGDLRAELRRRTESEREAAWAKLREAFPCPICQGAPVQRAVRVVEEYRFAPRDEDGRPQVYAPYDSECGSTHGVRHEISLTCENGHITTTDEIEWFKTPRVGPPILGCA